MSVTGYIGRNCPDGFLDGERVRAALSTGRVEKRAEEAVKNEVYKHVENYDTVLRAHCQV